MKPALKLWRLVAAGALVGLLAAPQVAQADGSVDLTSSMTAVCTDGSCSQIRFVLNVPLGVSVYAVKVNTPKTGSPWVFSSVAKIVAGGSIVYLPGDPGNTWSAGIDNSLGSIQVAFGGADVGHSPLPLVIWVNIDASSTGTASNLYDGSLTYFANGYTAQDQVYSTGGTVTPEPVSMVLIGTGLAGIAGVARRRRKDDV